MATASDCGWNNGTATDPVDAGTLKLLVIRFDGPDDVDDAVDVKGTGAETIISFIDHFDGTNCIRKVPLP
ncbi:hypothetical protein BGZ76_008114, partial [Entomortierella beljakovae]